MVFLYRIQEKEENRFQLTNSFTTVDSRSPKSLSEEYMSFQHHDRLAAARAHKKAHGGCDPVPFHQHTMVNYVHVNMLNYVCVLRSSIQFWVPHIGIRRYVRRSDQFYRLPCKDTLTCILCRCISS